MRMLIYFIVASSLPIESGFAFDNAEFCRALKHHSAAANRDAGTMLDNITRSDGLAVACNMKIVDFKKFINVAESKFRDGWRKRKQNQWNEIYCKDPYWRAAIISGWSIAQTITFADGTRIWMSAQCE